MENQEILNEEVLNEENQRVCSRCGRVIEDGEDYQEYDGEIYCEECFDENFTECADCGAIIPRDDAHWVNDGDYVICDYCCENNYYHCYECGELIHEDNATYLDRYDRHICESCLDNYYYCNECDEYVHSDDWNCEYDCCDSCAEENHCNGVVGYHDSDKCFKFYDNGENPLWHIGYELETGNTETMRYERDITEFLSQRLNVQFERDGSIEATSDVEIISSPQSMQYIYGIKDKMQECFEYLTAHGYKSHDLGCCGLHFHFSRLKDIDNNEVIARGWLILETFKDQILKISGRKSTSAHYYQWLSDNTNNYGESIKAIEKLKKNDHTEGTRYLAINNQNSNTIEFRFNRGTLNFKTFMARLEFSNNLYEIMTNLSKNIEEYSWNDLIKGEYISEYAKSLEIDNVDIKIKDYSIDIIKQENELKDKIRKAIKIYTAETHKRIRAIDSEKIIVKNFRETCGNMQEVFSHTTHYSGIVKTLENLLEYNEIDIKSVKYYIKDKGFDDDKIKTKICKIFDFDINEI